MRSQKSFLTSITIFFLSLTAGCVDDEIARFEHKNSEIFYENKNFNLPDLEENKDEGVLFVTRIKQATHEDIYVWISLYTISSPNAPIRIISTNFRSDNWEKNYSINKYLDFNESNKDGDLLKETTLVKVTDDTYDLFNNSPTITMEIKYTIGNDEKTMLFLIERRIEKYYIAYPT